MSVHPQLERETLTVVDPATLATVGSVAVTPPEALGEIVAEARMAHERWAREPLAERADLLRRVTRLLVADDLAIATGIVAETGKPIVEAYTHDLFVAAESLAWLANRLGSILAPERFRPSQLVLRHKRAWVTHEPLGVVAIVSPWNFPLGVSMSQVATAVAAGNAVVLKPSELTPLTGALIEDLFARAGAPAGLVRVVQGPGATVGAALVAHRGVDGVVFTGSTAVGREIGRVAGERLVPAVLELGGKDPMVVLDDADIDRAVAGALWGAFANCGQVCAGIERIYVDRGLHDAFVDQLVGSASTLRIGDGRDPRTELGPVVQEAARERTETLIADAVEHGAHVVYGGNRPSLQLPGWFLEPTILLGEPEASRLAREEIFGPVATIVAVDDEREAVRRASESAFGLGASVWTRDRDRGRRLAGELRAGSVWVNDHAYSYGLGEAPWGGRGWSGVGRTHGPQGLLALSHVKFTDADAGRLTPAWWYPYSEGVLDGFRGVLGGLHGDGLAGRAAKLVEHRRGVAHLLRKVLR